MKPLVSVEIDIGDFGTINTVTASDYAENSAFKGGEYAGSAISYKKNDLDPFILDHSELDNGREYADIYNGLVSNCVTLDRYMEDFYNKGVSGYLVNNYDSTLYYDYGYKITIKGENIKSFTIEFDKSVGYYPTYMMLGSRDVYMNDDYTFTHLVDSSSSGGQEYNLVIILMSKPNVPVVIKSITIDDIQRFSSEDSLISVNRGSQSVQDFALPSYGIVGAYGSISFLDTPNKMLYKLINGGYITENIDIRLFINDNIVGTYKSSNDWNYNVYSNKVSVSLKDKIEDLQSIKFYYSFLRFDSLTALDVFKRVLAFIVPGGWKKDLTSLDSEYESNKGNVQYSNTTHIASVGDYKFDFSGVSEYLDSISMPFVYFDEASVYDQINKLCNLFKIRCAMNANGIYVLTKYN